MNARNLRPANTAAAAVFIGGVLVAAFPEFAPSALRLVIVTVAATAGLYALAVHSPPAWGSPFNRGVWAERGARGSAEVRWIRSRLAGWRFGVGRVPPVPVEVLGMLRPLIVTALERQGVDLDSAAGRASARAMLSPLTRAVLSADPRDPGRWLRVRPPDRRSTAELVERVLNEVEGLTTT